MTTDRHRAGRRWSHVSILTVLRNRAYIGQIYFRGVHHDARHTPLVDTDTFDRAQRLLADRGEHVSKRASNGSDYLLGGLITCGRCGKRYVGMSAHGRSYRYRYYTCHTRHRYGTDACDGDRVPAGELDTAALNGVLNLFGDRELFDRVAADAAARRCADREQREHELRIIDAEVSKTEQAIERYLLAFEGGTLPEAQCGPRIRDLGAKLAELQDRRSELENLLNTVEPTAPTEQQLAAARNHIRDAIDNGDDKHRKHLLQALVVEIRVESREQITPVYRVPHAQRVDTVRAPETMVGLGLHNTSRHDTIDGPAISVSPLQAKLVDSRPSCRNAILDAIERLPQRTGATGFARRDIVAEVPTAGAGFGPQTIYRCLRRMSGQEPGSAHHDLEDLGHDGYGSEHDAACVPSRSPPALPMSCRSRSARGGGGVEDREVLIGALSELGEHAAREGVVVWLEPLNRYEDHMVNRLDQAAGLARATGYDAVQVVGDLYHMNIEEADLGQAIRDTDDLLSHVQIGDSNRLQPGAGHLDFAGVLTALDDIGYEGYLAMESGIAGDATVVLPAVATFMRGHMPARPAHGPTPVTHG